MDLTSEDILKLNVMLHSGAEAIRIDESRMTVHSLSGDSESSLALNPDCKPEQYIKKVREMLSGHVLGSPGGYPVFLKRWTRMGQARDEGLSDLLMLGEPEAVIAVANANGLTDELARRAWWSDPVSENARRMLANPTVAQGGMGKILAQHLVEHIAFETEPVVMIDTIRLVLQPDLIEDEAKQKMWASSARYNAYRVGFLQAVPDDLPEPKPAHPKYDALMMQLEAVCEHGNVIADMLLKTLTSQGQTYLATADAVLRKPVNQDVVVSLLNSVGEYFSSARQQYSETQDIFEIVSETDQLLAEKTTTAVVELHGNLLSLAPELEAILVLSRLSDRVVTPVFARTTAEGTLMRRK
ncbi:MAG: sulfur reduction protein DsrS, partial [Acidiferrobacterales bacterium]